MQMEFDDRNCDRALAVVQQLIRESCAHFQSDGYWNWCPNVCGGLVYCWKRCNCLLAAVIVFPVYGTPNAANDMDSRLEHRFKCSRRKNHNKIVFTSLAHTIHFLYRSIYSIHALLNCFQPFRLSVYLCISHSDEAHSVCVNQPLWQHVRKSWKPIQYDNERVRLCVCVCVPPCAVRCAHVCVCVKRRISDQFPIWKLCCVAPTWTGYIDAHMWSMSARARVCACVCVPLSHSLRERAPVCVSKISIRQIGIHNNTVHVSHTWKLTYIIHRIDKSVTQCICFDSLCVGWPQKQLKHTGPVE